MAADYDARLARLRDRRRGLTELRKSMHTADFAERSRLVERYEGRSGNRATKYALGAMQEVDPTFTRNCYVEGDRVKNQLAENLPAKFKPAFEYQGSVPLNVHIRGVSDVDLLALRVDFVTLDRHGPAGNTYGQWTEMTPVAALVEHRAWCEHILKRAFPAADVDTTGSKAIAISGGSLARKVDVVPSHWHDTAAYQASRQRKDRGVRILVKDEGRTNGNMPFLHIHEINVKDARTREGTKKAIRLLKNLRNDSDFAAVIKLSSYEVAGVVWHFDDASLTVAPWAELAIVVATQRNLEVMVANKAATMQLMTPDCTRRVIDTDEKFTGLVALKLEVDQLVEAIARELNPFVTRSGAAMSRSLAEAVLP
jgi:hypothetical protein